MFECPSRLKQWGATCLIQTRRNLRVTVYAETAAPLPFAHPHCSFSHSRNNHTPPFLAYSQCKSPAGSLVYSMAGKRKCHLGSPRPPFLRHSLSSSHVVHAVLVSLESDEQNFTLARASYYLLLGKKTYTQGTLLPSPCTLYISSCLTSPFTLWGYDKRWVSIGARTCVFVCGKTKQEGELGNPISHTEEQRQAGRYVPSPV